jgi:hypothetical protein
MTRKIEQLTGRLRTSTPQRYSRAGGRALLPWRAAGAFQEMAAADGIDADTKLLAVDNAATFHDEATAQPR